MAISFFLSSVGILPSGGSEGATILQNVSLGLATPLIMLGASSDLGKKNKKKNNGGEKGGGGQCGPLLISFIMAGLGTALAGIVAMCIPGMKDMLMGTLITDGTTMSLMGNGEGLKIAAALIAKNIGGGINYMAVCQSLGANPNAIAAGLCIDNVFALIYFPVVSALASGRPDVVQVVTDTGNDKDKVNNKLAGCAKVDELSTGNIDPLGIPASLSFATTIWYLSTLTPFGHRYSLPISTLLSFTFASMLPNIARNMARSGGTAIGDAMLHVFFATAGSAGIGIMMAEKSVRGTIVPLGSFLMILYSVHATFLVLLRMFVRGIIKQKQRRGGNCNKENNDGEAFQPQRLLVASSAAIGGPATAAALASSNGWDSLVGPSMIVGNLGYVVATFVGILFHAFFSSS